MNYKQLLPIGLVALLPACEDAGASLEEDLQVSAVSTKPYLVTGGDVLLRITGASGVDISQLNVTLNGADVSAAFRKGAEGNEAIGLVEGLRAGANNVEARAPGAEGSASLMLTNYPITGPIISGPHETPFICGTASFQLVNGEMLGAPLDANCSAQRRVDYVYWSNADGEFKPYAPGAGAPTADVAQVTTLDGTAVPFIVRVETGTINRGIYEIAMLHDPATPAPDPWTRSPGWNRKIVYTHGGGCRGGWFMQGDATGGVLREGLLEMGYALISSSLNVYGNNCADLLASETHIMTKERFVEAYGEPIYTIATGSSGGSYQSHQTADNYPGVFDGIIVTQSFPDVISTVFKHADTRLLLHYFMDVAPGTFTQDQELAVIGYGSWGSVALMSEHAARIDATHSPDAPLVQLGSELSLPELEPMRYSPANPKGVRATVYDHAINVFGADPATGFANRPLDNVGVQYGLAALNEGAITTAQFLDLNRRIGGFDADLNHVPQRHKASPVAARRAAESGRILFGGAGLATTPIIDYRSYTDHNEAGDNHMLVHQFTTRSRLEAANGNADNHVMSVGGRWGFTEESPDLGELFRKMDQWLMNIRADKTTADAAAKVVKAKPTDLVDNCWDTGEGGRINVQQKLTYPGTGRCNEIFPAYRTPRLGAGGPLTDAIVTCQLKPVDSADYNVILSTAELTQLREIFPEGVCDWSKPDAHSRGYQGTWQSFGPSPVNRVE